jgi:radical SAM superfamily enzyme YgiQ (UPF0313 family)
MRIAFIDGPWPGYGHRTQRWAHKNPGGNINPPPLFQMYAAAVCRRAGHEVRLWDCPAQNIDYPELMAELSSWRPGLVVVNSSTPSFDHDLNLVGQVKASLEAAVVLVGPHVSALAEQVLSEHPAIDLIALGEYDETINELALSLASPGRVRGLAYRVGDKPVRSEPRPPIADLDSLPYPAWDLVDINLYWESMFPKRKRPVATIMSSRGCNFRCSFCLYPQVLFPGKLRVHGLERVMEEITWLKGKLGARFFYFEDDNFTASWERLEQLCRLMLERQLNISWGCLSRIDGVTRERVQLMRRAGCFLVKYGVESGVQGHIDHIHKNIKLDNVLQAFHLTRQAGIYTHATVMLGLPGETHETIKATRAFVRRLQPDSVQFSICTPFPGTKFWDECAANGWVEYERWEDFDGVCGGVLSYPHLNRKEMRRAIEDSYLDYYSSPAHIKLRLRSMIAGPERLSQVERSFWLLRRLFSVLKGRLSRRLAST